MQAASIETSTHNAMVSMTAPQEMNVFKNYDVTQEKLQHTAHEFEEVFMSQMVKPMWEGVEVDEMFGGGAGEDVMRQLMIQEYGKSMARSNGYPMSQDIMKEMIKLQEQANGIKG